MRKLLEFVLYFLLFYIFFLKINIAKFIFSNLAIWKNFHSENAISEMTLAPPWNFNAQELQLKIISRKKVFLIKYAYFKYKFARRNCTRKTQILTHRLTKFQIPVLPRNYPESNVLKKKLVHANRSQIKE